MKQSKQNGHGGRRHTVNTAHRLMPPAVPRSMKSLLKAGVSLAMVALPFLVMPSEASAAATRAGVKDVGGFPIWYQDNNGVRVQLCYDPNDVNCTAPVSPTYNPNQPMSFPTPGNYPEELFYSAADSDLVVVKDASCPNFAQARIPAGGKGGSRIHMALEAAFLNGTLTPGDQMVFGRLRVISTPGNGLCPASWYTFRTPYGPITLKTDDNAEIQGAVASANTSDVGCVPGPVSPCNFNLALGAPVLGVGLLQQVDSPIPAAPGFINAAPGYLGSGVAVAGGLPALNLSTVTGGLNGFNRFEVVKWPAGVVPPLDANGSVSQGVGVDCSNQLCAPLGSTNLFSVAAKLAGPIGALASVDFGGQLLNTTSAAKSITLTNLGAGPLGLDAATISNVSISGQAANGPFAINAIDCPTTPLARDAVCHVAVTFNPRVSGNAPASLDITVAGSTVVNHVVLNGTGILAGQAPAASYTPADGNVDFGAVRLVGAGTQKTVTVTNTGTAPLVAIASLTGSASYRIVYDNCSTVYVAAGASCDIGLNYLPTAVGPVVAQLNIATNVTGGNFSFALSGHGIGGIAAVSPTNNAVNTLPDWYQDENGFRVGQCDDPLNTLCITAPLPVQAAAMAFPGNYPDEWFYYHAQSTPMAVSDCGLNPGTIFVEAGMEAAFLGPIAPDAGVTFGRLRIVSRGGGLCPNTQYRLTHPYGQTSLATDALGNIKPSAGTTDVGCAGPLCDYTIALSAPVSESFLRQTVHPDGYLGDPLNPSTVTGAPFLDPATGQPANYFKVERLDQAGGTKPPLAFTAEFGVSGRLVGPMLVSPALQEFGGVEVGLDSAAVSQTFTFTNDGPFNVTLAATNLLTVEGVNAADFTITGTTCTAGQLLAHAQKCTATVRFRPNATGNRTAGLKIQHSGANNPLVAALHGIGNSPAGTAAISASVTALKFADLRIGVQSESATVTLSNVGGQSALSIGGLSITAGQPFQITGNSCSGFVQPNATCSLSVQFHPNATGSFNAYLTISSNAILLPTLTIPVTGKSTDVLTAQSGTNINAGLPSWFQDRNGVRVEPCLAQDGNCVLLPDASFNPALQVAWPTNFPGETFYSLVDSDTITVPADASCGTTANGAALLRIATEASFAVLPPQAGGQLIFNRVRITAGGMCPNTTYDFIHPYGTTTLVTDAAGDIRVKAGTTDSTNVIGSRPMTPGLLQWDPNVAPAAPAGYLGDARTLHPIVGSQYRPALNAEPVNYFKIVKQATGATVGETKLFTVSGRIAGPVISNFDGFNFGTVEVGSTSATQNFVISNVGSTPVSGLTATLTGANASLFAITSNTCVTLVADGTCSIQVQFRPTVAAGAGAKQATLTLGHNGLRSPLSISLSGAANPLAAPALAVTPTTLAFGTVVSGTTSLPQTVTIRNSGTGALRLGTLLVGGTNPSQYTLTTGCPNGPTAAALAAGTSCSLTVSFKPSAVGAKPASIAVSATDAVTTLGHVAVAIPTVNVSLTGTGAQGTISTAATLAVGTRAGTTGTAKVTLTNTGTAPFSLTGPLTFTAVSTNNPVPRFSAVPTACTNVAAGKNCTVTVSFNVPAGTRVATVYSVDMTIPSNASNNALKVRVNGTVR